MKQESWQHQNCFHSVFSHRRLCHQAMEDFHLLGAFSPLTFPFKMKTLRVKADFRPSRFHVFGREMLSVIFLRVSQPREENFSHRQSWITRQG